MRIERKLIDKYQGKQGDYQFPDAKYWDDGVDKDYIEAIWSRFVNGGCATSPTSQSNWSMNRLYGAGKQPESIYYAWLSGSKKYPVEMSSVLSEYDMDTSSYAKKVRKGWDKVDFTVHSFIPKIKASIKGLLADVDYIVKAEAVDPFSKDEEENSKWRSLVFAENQAFLLSIANQFQTPVEDMQFIPDSIEEMELHAANEGYKVNWAVLMDKLIRFTFDISGYSEQKEMWIDDLLDNGMAVSRDEVDPDTGLVVHSYVNPANFVIQYSQFADYHDSTYAGSLDMVPFSVIKTRIEPGKYGQLESAMSYYADIYDNMPESEWDNTSVREDNTIWKQGMNKALVLDCAYIITDYDYYKEIKYRHCTRLKKTSHKDSAGNGRERMVAKPKRMVRVAKWVVGTDIVYDNGNMYNQPKSKYGREVRLPYHVYSLPYKALVPSLRGLADDYQKAILVYQNALMTAPRDLQALNVHMLQNVKLNGQPAKVEDIIEFSAETGKLPYSYSQTGQYKGGAGVPVSNIPSPMLSIIQSQAAKLDMIYRQVQEETGINLLSMGASPTPSTQVGTAELGYQATMNVLKPIITSCFKIKESIAKNAVYRIQNAVTWDKRFETAYSGILSNTEVALLQEAETNGCMYSIVMKAKPNRDHVQNLLNTVQESYRAGMLAPDDYLYVMEQVLNEHDTSRIRQYVSYKLKKREDKAQADRMQAINQQNSGLAQIEEQKMNAKMQEMVAAGEQRIKEILTKNQGALDVKMTEIQGLIEVEVRKQLAKQQ